jgi:kynureninase
LLARHFGRFFAANPGWLHFGAHSHHPWPDATQSAHERYWVDSATRVDRKWDKVFGEIVPAAQGHVARLLNLADAKQVAFAPNTHEFVGRLFSCLDFSKPVRVLASAHEFHSFRRQARRLVETGRVELVEIPAEPYDTFTSRFAEACAHGAWDMVWLSQVFFDSGFVVNGLATIVEAAPRDALVVIDGYHAFCALPVDLQSIRDRAFYIAGGYKYAMSGEGACFLAVPPGNELRPVDTGWYASFETLSGAPADRVPYSDGAMRFWGATFDPSGLYRFGAAMDWMQSAGATPGAVHEHAQQLQERFLGGLASIGSQRLGSANLVPGMGIERGNFLTFDVDDAETLHKRILDAGIYVDRRGRRVRFGFGVYHDAASVDALTGRLGAILR